MHFELSRIYSPSGDVFVYRLIGSILMKSLFAVFCLFGILTTTLIAQEETLLGMEDIEHGGYGGVVVKFTSINNQFALLVGGRGGWIINHTFILGFGGYGLVNNVPSYIVGPFGERFVDFGYGGLDLEYVFDSDRLIHLSLHALIGGGGVRYRGGWEDNTWNNDTYHSYDAVFVVEPGMNLDLNVIQWFRLSAGASFRFVRGATSGVSTNRDLSGPAAQLTFRFGKF